MPTPCPNRALRSRLIAAAMLTLCSALMPGCVAYEIRDELRTTNFRLSSLETQLEELQRTNQRLELVRTQLQILESIRVSLANLDEHLSAVRVVISSMSSMMAMFDFSPDEPAQPGEGDPQDPDAPGSPDAPDLESGDAPAPAIAPAPAPAPKPAGQPNP